MPWAVPWVPLWAWGKPVLGSSLVLRQEEAGLRPAIPATGPDLQSLSLGSCSYQPDPAFGLGPAHWPHLKLPPAWSCTSHGPSLSLQTWPLGPTLCWPSPGLMNSVWFPEILVLHAERAHPSCRDPGKGVEPQQWCCWIWCEQQALQFSRNLCVHSEGTHSMEGLSPLCPTICKTHQRPKS